MTSPIPPNAVRVGVDLSVGDGATSSDTATTPTPTPTEPATAEPAARPAALSTVEGHRAFLLPIDGAPRQIVLPLDVAEQQRALDEHLAGDLVVPVLATWCQVWISPQLDTLPRNPRASEFLLRGLRGDVVVTGLSDGTSGVTALTAEQLTFLVEATRSYEATDLEPDDGGR